MLAYHEISTGIIKCAMLAYHEISTEIIKCASEANTSVNIAISDDGTMLQLLTDTACSLLISL